jgi:signal peptidase II
MPFVGGEQFIFFSPVFNFADACVSVSVVALFLFCRKELATLTLSPQKPASDEEEQEPADTSADDTSSTPNP